MFEYLVYKYMSRQFIATFPAGLVTAKDSFVRMGLPLDMGVGPPMKRKGLNSG